MKRWRRRRGATLIELLVSVTILGIMGAAIVRLFVSQSRYVDQTAKQRSARAVSRASANLLLAEVRGVETGGGVVLASPTALEVRSPYALGVSCGSVGGQTVVSLLPVDSAAYTSSGFAGYAWRDGGGLYSYVEGGSGVAPSAASAVCDASGITTLPQGRLVEISPAIPAPNDVGAAVLVYQRLRYEFRSSLLVPGRRGLWRIATPGSAEEVAAPFDSSSGFRYFRDGVDSSEVMPPAVLADLRGVELVFTGASEFPRAGRTAPETATQRVAVFFLNRPAP